MNIHVSNESVIDLSSALHTKDRYKRLSELTRDVIASWRAMDVTLIFVDDKKMRELNATYRGIDRTTDVLSFMFEPDRHESRASGELYISTPQALKQSRTYAVSTDEEIKRLVIHGLLHLQGYDHVKQKERLIMRALERKISQEATRQKIW